MLYNPTPTLIRLLLSFSCLLFIAVYGAAMLDNPLSVNLLARHLPPDALYWFGTDNLGRDLWIRCFQGALTSLQIGIGAALCSGDYLTLTWRLGHGHFYCWRHHYLPALLPQWLTGTLLMFPHAVLHSAALSFLGFGLAPHEPSLGLLLADALRFISHGDWWLVLFPGLMLFSLVMLFDQLARAVHRLWLRGDAC